MLVNGSHCPNLLNKSCFFGGGYHFDQSQKIAFVPFSVGVVGKNGRLSICGHGRLGGTNDDIDTIEEMGMDICWLR